ncbi:lysozyme [Phenylobacterium soli]|uniref:Lysozyme n=1 Tax=Phenylobacterium soli TaxID=2170551 RepID=A0A328AJK2_9CAUL|nr:lysozyme [Phenylobacterium soli]RAK55123.1 lysozyme [Phenylobacterium soli]
MKPRHRVSRAAINLITRFEGYRRKAAQLPDGRWMIGYGHTLTAREGAEVGVEDAEALLLYDLIQVSHGLNEWIYAPLNQNQFDALASFTFNIGLDNFRRSTVLKRLNEGAAIQAACAMELWRKAEFGGERIVIDALVRRRASEKALFLTPPDGWPTAPSPVLQPLLDVDADGLVPREPPAPVTADLAGEEVRVLRADEPAPPPVPPEDEGASPVLAAAEAVASRLQTIFAEPAAEGAAEVPAEADEQEPQNIPAGEESDLVAPEGETLNAASEIAEPAPETIPDEPFAPEIEAALGGHLLDAPAPEEPAEAPSAANDAEVHADTPAEEPQNGHRVLIDDTAPFEFTAPIVQPLKTETRGGPVSLAALAVIGLAFFGGGVFWALNARGAPQTGMVNPLIVGWLAGIAGVGLFSVAVFLLLQRLARADR